MTRYAPRFARLSALLLGLMAALLALAQDAPFAGGWVLQPGASSLSFQSVKNAATVEQSGFATLTGSISEDGTAAVQIALDSVDTRIDLRNVRMRFLFFETFEYPQATITAGLDPTLLADLPTKRRLTIALPYRPDLHGVAMERTADGTVTLITDSLVNLSSVGTIPVQAADFDLSGGITKLQEAAKVKILPAGSVTFDFMFERAGTAAVAAAEPAAPATILAPAAPETTGNFDTEACLGQFQIVSNAGNISFRSASARLNLDGSAILDNFFDIVTRCPDMTLEIGGRTDNDGSDATNLALSEKRAASGVACLLAKGIPAARLQPRRHGEATPLVPNDNAATMAHNRHIEFKVLN